MIRQEMDETDLNYWGLPKCVVSRYHENGLRRMFSWQASCLSLPAVLDGKNLVYSAPTSAGKSLIAEILLFKRIMQTRKRAIMIFPFISVAREKLFALKRIFEVAGLRVDGYIGGVSPPGGFSSLDIAVCTIEKANSLINRLIDDNRIDQLGMIVVDELHMVSDEHRGYLIELLLTKVRFMCNKSHRFDSSAVKLNVQIVGMSATVPNLELLALWLDAASYETDFRPVSLQKCVKIGDEILDEDFKKIRNFKSVVKFERDEDDITGLCFETIQAGHALLIFCPTKNWCEKLAMAIAYHFYQFLRIDIKHVNNSACSFELRSNELRDIVEQLKQSPAGLDDTLLKTIPFGVAFHHAGLTTEERDIIENGFRSTIIRVLVATSTLSSGVNLPARRVIIRTPVFNKQLLDVRTYHQMAGRAGRKGIDEAGESILICKSHEKAKCKRLVTSKLNPINSCLVGNLNGGGQISAAMKRAILEIIVNGLASTLEDIQSYMKCTLLFAELMHKENSVTSKRRRSGTTEESVTSIDTCIQWLENNEFIFIQNVKDVPNDESVSKTIVPTQLGRAALMSSLPTAEALRVLADLQTASKALALDTELHLIYQVTPIFSFSNNLSWHRYLQLYQNLSVAHQRVGNLVGIEEHFLTRMAAAGDVRNSRLMSEKRERQFNIHTRFYAALILHDLVQEVPLNIVCEKYDGNRGTMQSLQLSAATFAGMVTAFCQQLGWWSLEVLLKEFQTRLIFGIQRELIDLTQISLLNNERARALYAAGLITCDLIAQTIPSDIEIILRNARKFTSKKCNTKLDQFESDANVKLRTIVVPGSNTVLTEEAAAIAIVQEAKKICNISSTTFNTSTEAMRSVLTQNDVNENREIMSTRECETVLQEPSNQTSLVKKDIATIKLLQVDERDNESGLLLNKNLSTYDDSEESMFISRNCTRNTSPKREVGDSFETKAPEESSGEHHVLPQDSTSNKCNALFGAKQANGPTASISPNSIRGSLYQSSFSKLKIPTSEDRDESSVALVSSLSESQLAAILGGECSFMRSQCLATSSPNFDHTPELRQKSQRAGLKDDNSKSFLKEIDLSNCQEIAFSTPVEHSSAKVERSSFQQSHKGCGQFDESSENNCLFNSFSFTTKKENPESDLLTEENNQSNDMFNLSADASNKKSTNRDTDSRNRSVNCSDDSLFKCFNDDSMLVDKENQSMTYSIRKNSSKVADSSTAKDIFSSSLISPNDADFPFSMKSLTGSLHLDETKATSDKDFERKECLNIIDVRKDAAVYRKFFEDWSMQTEFSLSIATERDKSTTPKTFADLPKEYMKPTEFVKKLYGFYIYWGQNNIYHIKCKSTPDEASTEQVLHQVKKKFSSSMECVVITRNIKNILKLMFTCTGHDQLNGSWQDPDIAAWLLDQEHKREDGLKLLNKYAPQYSTLLEKLAQSAGTNFNKTELIVNRQFVTSHVDSCVEAFASFHVMKQLKPLLWKAGLWNSFTTIEMPHAISISHMEANGIRLDTDLIIEYKAKLQTVCEKLQLLAWKIVGRKFNLSSPKEIGKILFVEMRLNPDTPRKKISINTRLRNNSKLSSRKLRQEWSTSREVLEVLCEQNNPHPLPKIIMQWRSLDHALNKVIHPLHFVVTHMTSRTRFERFHPICSICTATGRVAMNEPNLQNMPKPITLSIPDLDSLNEMEEETICMLYNFRNIVVASKGFVLLAADYSQLELRVMAHMSGDETLLGVLNSDGDVFRSLAAKNLGKSLEEVTIEERTNAKRLCYGILYGMGALTLSKQMRTTESAAQLTIDRFMSKYPQLQAYLREVVEDCKTKGYVVTISGRRRYLPLILSSSIHHRSHAQRQAANSTIQGSAADLVKAATCKVARQIRNKGWNMLWRESGDMDTAKNSCYFVHHIHDEIMYEVESCLVNEAARIILDSMLNALPLKVRLAVKLKTGPAWGNLEEYEVE